MKLLVISLAGIGDTLLATSILRELRLRFDPCQIDALVLWKGSADVLEGNSNLALIHRKDLTACSKMESFRFLNRLRRERYDLSINVHPQSRKAYRVIARLIGARDRLSHEYDGSSWVDRKLMTQSIPQDYKVHSVENNLRLIDCLGKPRKCLNPDVELVLTDGHRGFAEKFFSEHRLPGQQCIGFHVGSGATKNLALKRWPLENYQVLFDRLLRDNTHLIALLFGGPQEKNDHQVLLDAINSDRLLIAPSPDLKHAAAMIQKCDAFVSVDTALMHIAAAVKVKNQIVIEAPTLNATNTPYRNPYRLVPNPVVHGRNLDFYRYDGGPIRGTTEELIRCMKSVTVDAVYTAIMEELK